ncbi:proprotein convertase subtilisin/kexin type 6-like [Mercenaria mercenaria]|uniref:proprotein convertase subtilisin/kexin type 6-like n=1 Tax=Mercenaria mercenaria TaxID=6596 RepID=UPI00234FB398|nr:proprotein convertase subtilisin/kexin type 6-like [Mercenaria mercenaria]
MGVEEAWSQGYTGKGVTIATMDVGIDTHLLDLERNINQEWSYNFVQDNTDVTAEHFHFDHPVLGHGNNIASVLAAEKGNSICSAGIAYNATIVVLKVFQVILSDHNVIQHWTASDIIARAMIYKLVDIDISVMAWSFVSPFQRLDLATREGLTYGAETGRRGLGKIYVVSAGPSGNELTNNIYTITVNGIGRHGTLPQHICGDTSVLVSGLSDGNTLTSTYMVTTTVNNECTARFKGVSAATSQVAAIIGLALQANPSLMLRDIQHLLVQSAEYKGLDETDAFSRNGAGRFYHRFFGFGLLNATKLVTLAKKRQKAPVLLNAKLEQTAERISEDGHSSEYKFCHCCNASSKQPCLTVIEHVVISLVFETYTRQLNMDLTSPSGTRSKLMRESKRLDGTTIGQLVSVHFWDELAIGEWTFNFHSIPSLRSCSQTNVSRVSVTLYGTNAIQQDVKGHSCDYSCRDNVEYENKRPKQQPDQPRTFLFFSNNIAADRILYLVIVFGSLGIAIVLTKFI